MTSFRTPLNKVRGLGSAKSGVHHWVSERISAIAGLPLVLFAIWLGVSLAGADHAAVAVAFHHPLTAILAALFLLTQLWHMKLGMQVIIEDYVHSSAKIVLLLANSAFTYLLGALALYALVKLSFGA